MRTDVQPDPVAASAMRRKTLRLACHDYAGGLYYVTQATQLRQRLFGSLLNGRMRLSPAGRMVHDVWHEIPQFCPAYSVDEFVVMPDHIHGIVRVNRDENNPVEAPLRGRLCYHDYRRNRAPTEGRIDVDNARHDEDNACHDAASATLFDFMQRFKSLTTARYRHGVAEQQWPRFDGRVWQREYYEHIVRHDGADLRRIRDYIRNNPANANLLRFGTLRYYGNRNLLNLRKTGFLASRSKMAVAPTEGRHDKDNACHDTDNVRLNIDCIANAQCVISGFLSPLERAMLRACHARDIPTIHVLACGRVTDEPLSDSRLVVTPFDPDIANVSEARAAWCNQYVMENADDIVIGRLNPDGMLAFQLADLPCNTPVTVLSEGT